MGVYKGGSPISLRSLFLAGCCMVTAQLIFSIYTYLTARVLHAGGASPLAFAWLRDLLAVILLLSATTLVEMRKPVGERCLFPAQDDLIRVALCGLLGVWGSQGMSALALANLDPFFFAIFQPLMPIVTLTVGTLLGIEPPLLFSNYLSWCKVIGLCVSIAGAVCVVLSSSSGSGGGGSGSTVLGGIFLAIQLTLGGSYPVIQRPLVTRYPALAVAAWGYTAGLGLLTLSVITGASNPSDWSFSNDAIIAIVFAGIFASAVAYSLMAFANSLAGPVVLVIFFPLMPLGVALIEWVFDGKAVGWKMALSGLAIAIGLCVVLVAKSKEVSLPPTLTNPNINNNDGDDDDDDEINKEEEGDNEKAKFLLTH
jgi:drug/metabolite transporter (DMT)-like permease